MESILNTMGASAETVHCVNKVWLVPACLAVGQLLFMQPHRQTNFIAGGKCSCSICTWKLLMRGTVTFFKVCDNKEKIFTKRGYLHAVTMVTAKTYNVTEVCKHNYLEKSAL